jgi:hypothetical protein
MSSSLKGNGAFCVFRRSFPMTGVLLRVSDPDDFQGEAVFHNDIFCSYIYKRNNNEPNNRKKNIAGDCQLFQKQFGRHAIYSNIPNPGLCNVSP